MNKAIRIGLKLIRGMSQAEAEAILEARKSGPFSSLGDFVRRTAAVRLTPEAIERLHRMTPPPWGSEGRGTGNGEQGTEDGKSEMGNRKSRMGYGVQGTGYGDRKSSPKSQIPSPESPHPHPKPDTRYPTPVPCTPYPEPHTRFPNPLLGPHVPEEVVVNVKRDTIEMLIMGGAFDSLHSNRRALLWAMDELVALRSSATGLVEADTTAYDAVVEKYAGTGYGVWGTGYGVQNGWNPASGIGNRHPELVEGWQMEADNRKSVILRQAQDDEDRVPNPESQISDLRFQIPLPDSSLHNGRRLKPAATGCHPGRLHFQFPVSGFPVPHTPYPEPDTRYPIPGTPPISGFRFPTSDSPIRDFSAIDKFWLEYRVLGLTPSCHVMSYIREELTKRKVLSTKDFREQENGARVWVGGLSVRPHRPPTRSGKRVLFVTLEDEFGMAPVTFFERSYKEWGHVLFNEPLVAIRGRIQRQVRGVTLIADKAVAIPWKALCPDEEDNTEKRRGEAMKRRANTWLSPFPQR